MPAVLPQPERAQLKAPSGDPPVSASNPHTDGEPLESDTSKPPGTRAFWAVALRDASSGANHAMAPVEKLTVLESAVQAAHRLAALEAPFDLVVKTVSALLAGELGDQGQEGPVLKWLAHRLGRDARALEKAAVSAGAVANVAILAMAALFAGAIPTAARAAKGATPALDSLVEVVRDLLWLAATAMARRERRLCSSVAKLQTVFVNLARGMPKAVGVQRALEMILEKTLTPDEVSGQAGCRAIVLLSSIAHAAAQLGVPLSNSASEHMATYAAKAVAGGRTPIPDAIVAAFANSLWACKVPAMPAMLQDAERLLLRAPELASRHIAVFLGALLPDAQVSNEVGAWLDGTPGVRGALVDALRSSSAVTRNAAETLVQLVSTCSTTGALMEAIVEALGRTGLSADVRGSLYRALMVAAPNAATGARVAKLVSAAIVRETSDDLASLAIGAVASQAAVAPAAALAGLCGDVLKRHRERPHIARDVALLVLGRSPLRVPSPRALYDHVVGLLAAGEPPAVLKALVEELHAAVARARTQALQLAAQREQPEAGAAALSAGVAALVLLLRLQNEEARHAGTGLVAAANSAADLAGALGAAAGTVPFWADERVFSKLDRVADAAAVNALMEHLLAHLDRYNLARAAHLEAVVAWATLVQPLPECRRAACAAISRAGDAQRQSLVGFSAMNALVCEAVSRRIDAGGVSDSHRVVAVAQAVTTALKHHTSATQTSSAVNALLLWLIPLHDPAVFKGVKGSKWGRLCVWALGSEPSKILAPHVDRLVGEWLPQAASRAAVLQSLGYVARVCPAETLDCIAEWAAATYESASLAIAGVSAADMAIWRNGGTPLVDAARGGKTSGNPKAGKMTKEERKEAEAQEQAAAAAAAATFGRVEGYLRDLESVGTVLASVLGLRDDWAFADAGQEAMRTVWVQEHALRVWRAFLKGPVALAADDQGVSKESLLRVSRLLAVVAITARPLSGSRAVSRTSRLWRMLRFGPLSALAVECLCEPWSDALSRRVMDALVALRAAMQDSGAGEDELGVPPAVLSIVTPLLTRALAQGTRAGDGAVLAGQAAVKAAGTSALFPNAAPRLELVQALATAVQSLPRVATEAAGALQTLCEQMGDEQAARLDRPDAFGTRATSLAAAEEAQVCAALLEAAVGPSAVLRETALAGLAPLEIPEEGGLLVKSRVAALVAQFDDSGAGGVARRGAALTSLNGSALQEDCVDALLALVTDQQVEEVGTAAGRALAATLSSKGPAEAAELRDAVVARLLGAYQQLARPLADQVNAFGLVVVARSAQRDPVAERLGVARALKEVCGLAELKYETVAALEALFGTLMSVTAPAETAPLGDRDETVRGAMLDAALATLRTHGGAHVRRLYGVLDAALAVEDGAGTDAVRESAVVCLGALAAAHIPAGDAAVPRVIGKLIEALRTPSERVQEAVARVMPPLVRRSKERVPALVAQLLGQLTDGPTYAVRRGAAYGLGGVVRAAGVRVFREQGLLASLRTAAAEKARFEAREGAMMAYEVQARLLGRVFEPYMLQVVPDLLAAFADGHRDVRRAAEEAAREAMAQLSAHGARMVLPLVLPGLEDKAWRARVGSVEMLGSMAFLAGRQLSAQLPAIVPQLCEVLTDPHERVRTAAEGALAQFEGAVKTPEVRALVPALQRALVDPSAHTAAALDAVLATPFEHYLDRASLALLMPVVARGLSERVTTIKVAASRIVGNMARLADAKDLVGYLGALVPAVMQVLVDAVPGARATAARALGMLVGQFGETRFPRLVAQLLAALRTSELGGTASRWGAAQGLAEVLAALGVGRLETVLPDVLKTASDGAQPARVREAFLVVLAFLPATFGAAFVPFVAPMVPCVLGGLADDSESVRAASLRAGQVVIRNYARQAVALLLPELEKGFASDSWRIRQTSLQLVGDLLFRLGGISTEESSETADADAPEADAGEETKVIGSAEAVRAALEDALGKETLERVLAGICLARHDGHAPVRSAATHLWRHLVPNTPRTLRELLPVLLGEIVEGLSGSRGEERQAVAAAALGDLVRRLGTALGTALLPRFEAGLADGQPVAMRRGVCVAVAEVAGAAGRNLLEDLGEPLLVLVRRVLADDDAPTVREAAAHAFDLLAAAAGARAVEETTAGLLALLGEPGAAAERALEALRAVLAVRSGAAVFPALLQSLTATQPMDACALRALGELAAAAGANALERRLETVLGALGATAAVGGLETESLVDATLEKIASQLEAPEPFAEYALDQLSRATARSQLGEEEREVSDAAAAVACRMLAAQCRAAGQAHAMSRETAVTMQTLLWRTVARQDLSKSLVPAWTALDTLVRGLARTQLDDLVEPMRENVRHIGDSALLEASELPRAFSPVVAVLLHGLLQSDELRLAAAQGLADVVAQGTPATLAPFTTQVAGALIRVLGDRAPPAVRVALLSALAALLEKVPSGLRAFLPMLQRTFITTLRADDDDVRGAARACLVLLCELQPRLDLLVTELLASGTFADALNALSAALTAAHKLGRPLQPATVSAVRQTLGSVDRGTLSASALSDLERISLVVDFLGAGAD